jgi:NADH dehydrogenase [ubiquinone] 1 alpha subcomplex assembly factor 6
MMSLRRSVAAGPFSHTSIRNRYSQSAAFDFCIDFVKNHDFDNYLAGLMIPKHIRPHFYAIRAYNIEMSLVKDQANNNAMTARVRFQWWREIIESAYVEHTEISNEHPVAMALQVSIKQMKLNRRWVDRILESRQADVSTEQAATLSDLETYAEQSSSSVLYLILEMLGIMQEKADYAASHVGVSYGLMTSLRSIAYLSAQV